MEAYEQQQVRQIKLVIKWVVGVIVGLWILSTLVVIPTGRVGVVTSFGKVSGREMSEGLNFKAPFPFQSVWKADMRVQKEESNAQAASLDLQVVHAKLALNYHLERGKVSEVYQSLGAQYKERIVDPAVQEIFKASTARYTASELLTKRAEVKSVAHALLEERLHPRGIVVDDLSIVNFDFSDEFNKAIEQKQVAQQEAERAGYRLETARKEADAQNVQKTSLTRELLTRMFIEKWNGQLPQYLGSDTIFGLQVPK